MKDKNQNTPMLMTSKAERYTEYALEHLTTRLAKDGQPFSFIDDENNRIVHSLHGKWLKSFLRKGARNKGENIRSDDLKEIGENLYAHAAVDDKRLEIHLRVGRNRDGDVELDLGNENFDRILFNLKSSVKGTPLTQI